MYKKDIQKMVWVLAGQGVTRRIEGRTEIRVNSRERISYIYTSLDYGSVDPHMQGNSPL